MPADHDKQRSHRALGALNFVLADVRDGMGPYLAIWLLVAHQWDAASIGLAMGAMPLASVLMLGPAGAWFDAARHKRALIAGASAVVALACIAMPLLPTLGFVVAGQAAIGMATAVIGPGVLALSLGVAGRRGFDRRMGRNEVWNHAGNVTAAIAAGLIGHFVSHEAIFYLVAFFSLLSMIAVLRVRAEHIDHRVARGSDTAVNDAPAPAPSWRALATPALAGFAVAVFLFHFANAAMLPLVGQALASGRDSGAALVMSACIVVAQLVMIPMAALAGRQAGRWGRRPLLLLAFSALPVRGLLYTVSDDPAWMIAVQALDGVGAGLLGVVGALIVADLTRGSGHTNAAHGLLAAAHGVGAFLSNSIAGQIVASHGYNAGFLALAGVAALALLVCLLAVPETLQRNERSPSRARGDRLRPPPATPAGEHP